MGIKAEQKEQFLTELFKYVRQSSEFNSLKEKTQVLNLGVEDKSQGLTTRAIHSEQVADNAGRLVENAGGTREEIALARLSGISHDLGHTPMGHDGEAALSRLLKEVGYKDGFRHSQYGAKVFAKIFDRYCDEQLQWANSGNLPKEKAQEIRDKVDLVRFVCLVINIVALFSFSIFSLFCCRIFSSVISSSKSCNVDKKGWRWRTYD